MRLLFACLCGYGAYALNGLGQQGFEGASVFALASGGVAVLQVVHALSAWDACRDEKRLSKEFEAMASDHGSSQFGDEEHLKQAGLRAKKGILLGRFKGRDVRFAGEGAITVVAPPGSGKGTGLVIPNLLTWVAPQDDWLGSILVIDAGGELAATTRRQQERLGRRVITECPWPLRLQKVVGRKHPIFRCNPLAGLDRGSMSAKEDAEALASLILPGVPKEVASGNSLYFDQFGREMVTAFILDELWWEGSVTLPALCRRLMTTGQRTHESLAKLAMNDGFRGAVQQYGEKLIGTYVNSPAEFSGGLSTAQQAVTIYDELGELGWHVSGHDVDRSLLKKEPTAWYLVIPPELVRTHGRWLNLAISTTIEMMARSGNNRRCLILCDEAANVGYLPNLLQAIAAYRRYGCQVVTVWQQASQAPRIYGNAAARELWGMSDVFATFGVREPEELRRLSEMLGTETIATASRSAAPKATGGAREPSYSLHYQSRPLMRPEALRTMEDGKALVLHRNSKPLLLDKINYLTDPALRKAADPNPLYDRSSKQDEPATDAQEGAAPAIAALPYYPVAPTLSELLRGDGDADRDR
jgi:type IV secretion system protein VirD4